MDGRQGKKKRPRRTFRGRGGGKGRRDDRSGVHRLQRWQHGQSRESGPGDGREGEQRYRAPKKRNFRIIPGLVLPGDLIGTEEEYLPGEGTFERDGKIYSGCVGQPIVDIDEMTAHIKPAGRSPYRPGPGDRVIARVTALQDNMVNVRVLNREGREERVAGEGKGSIHVSQIEQRHTSSAIQAFREGDLIRAWVVQSEPTLKLSTSGEDFGVIHSRCHGCGSIMEARNGSLFCSGCDSFLHTKKARDYGSWEH
jgi:exosome complex component CSL4